MKTNSILHQLRNLVSSAVVRRGEPITRQQTTPIGVSHRCQSHAPAGIRRSFAAAAGLWAVVLLLGVLTAQQGKAQIADATQVKVARLAAFLCRTEATNMALYPISAPSIVSNVPPLSSSLVDAELCGIWANAFARKGVLLDSPNLQLKILQSIQLNIQNFVGTITKDDLKSPNFTAKIKAEVEKRLSDMLLLLTTPRLKIILQKTAEEAAAGKLVLSMEKLTRIMLDAEWMFFTDQKRALAAWDSLYLVHLPLIESVPTNDQKVSDFIIALTAAFNAGSTAVPTVTASVATPAATTADLPGNVTSDGGATVLERGIVLAKTGDNNNPQLGGTMVTKVTPPAPPGASRWVSPASVRARATASRLTRATPWAWRTRGCRLLARSRPPRRSQLGAARC